MNIRRIFPMETNLRFRNLKNFVFQKEYVVNRTDEQPVYFYLDAATYNNLGDQAISLAMEWFLDDEFGREHVRVVNETDIISYIKSLKKQMRKEDVIILSGGGNMGDLYPRYESLRRKIIRNFPDNKIVIFPQTIDYTDDRYGKKEKKKSSIIYSQHKNLVVCAREMKSYIIMAQLYPNVILIPDIVFYLYGKLELKVLPEKKIGICFRDDSESVISDKLKICVYSAIKKLGYKIIELSTMAEDSEVIINDSNRKDRLIDKLIAFKKCQCIITDRLHGMIFSLIANVPCIIIDNKNHKVIGVYEMARVCLQGVFKLDNTMSIDKQISDALSSVVHIEFSKINYKELIEYIVGE